MYSVEVLRRVGVCHVAVQPPVGAKAAGAGTVAAGVSVKVVGRRWLHIGNVVQIDLGEHAALRPQDTPPPTVTAAGVVKFRFSLAGDLAVPGASAVSDELLLGAVEHFSRLSDVVTPSASAGKRKAAAVRKDASGGENVGVQVVCRGCRVGLLKAGCGVTRFLPGASAALAEVVPWLTCSGGLSDYFAEAGSSSPGVCLVNETDLGLCDYDVDQDRVQPKVVGAAADAEGRGRGGRGRDTERKLQEGDQVTVECARCRSLLGGGQCGKPGEGTVGILVHQCAVDVIGVKDSGGGGSSKPQHEPRRQPKSVLLPREPTQVRSKAKTFTSCAARALLSATVTWSVQRLVVVPASAAGTATARLCLWMVSPPIERAHGRIHSSYSSSIAAPQRERVLQRTLKVFFTKIGGDDAAVPAGWEESATVRTLTWPTELVVVVVQELLASVTTAPPGSREGPAGFKVGYLSLE